MNSYKASEFLTSLDKTDFLGNGSYASVRRCFHKDLGNVVVKCFTLTGSEVAISKTSINVGKKAEVLFRLQHENIIKFHGVTLWNSCYGLILEEATGYNLEDLFIYKTEIQNISWLLRRRILHDIASGLDHLHNCTPGRSYIHGDLKLPNILLTHDLKAKIADFGAVSIAMASNAFSASIESEPNSKQYTLLYSLPELLKDSLIKRTCAMDIYSFGMIGYEIITRQRIFHRPEGSSSITLVTQLIKDTELKPDERFMEQTKSCIQNQKDLKICRCLEEVVKKCWQSNPKSRPPIKAVKKDLEDYKVDCEELKETEDLRKPKPSLPARRIPLTEYGVQFQSLTPEISVRTCNVTEINPKSSIAKKLETKLNPSSQLEIVKHELSMGTYQSGTSSPDARLISGGNERSRIEPTIETEKFNNILQTIQTKENVILHCSGVPGSGTSQIVRELHKRFPFSAEDNKVGGSSVKKHIRCKDRGHDVKEELKDLVDELRKDNVIDSYEKHQKIIADIDVGVTDKLVEVLLQANVPVLIIVEDPVSDKTNKNNKLLQDLLRNLNKKANLNKKRLPKHLYISSRYETAILENQESSNMEIYIKETVTGFTKKEAIEYLKINGKLEEKDKTAAEELYKRFNGLPLGLQVAKGYCVDARIEYQTYLDLINNCSIVMSAQEKEEITKEFGDSAEYMFQAIVMPFIPRSESSNSKLYWKILTCLSYLNFYRIPRSAIEYCAHVLREKKVDKSTNTSDVGLMITKLLRHDMCIVTSEQDIILHEVVNNAFRLVQLQDFTLPFNPIEKAIEVMSGLVSKDMRKNVQSQKMYKLRRHLQTLLGHVKRHKKDLFKDEENCFMMKQLTSHLYETAATIMLNESPALFLDESDKYFKKALKLVSKEVYLLIKNLNGTDYDKEAKSIVAKSKEIGKTLPEKFTIQYNSNLSLDFDSQEKDFLLSKCQTMGSDKLDEFFDSYTKKINLLEDLQKHKLLLSDLDYCPIFYAERVASILHSYSRLILYADSDKIRQDDKWMWMTKLSNSISVKCRESSGVSLLTERLSQAWGLIPIILKLKKQNNQEYKEMLNLCKNILLSDKSSKIVDMYENGLLKKDFGLSKNSTRLSLLKSITRFNARTVKLSQNQIELDEADRYCQELLDLANANALKMSSSAMSIIYCAKYYAARNQFKKCMSCFEEFFEVVKGGDFNLRFNVRCWAVYNYAKAVIVFEAKAESLLKAAIVNKCKQVLNDNEVMSLQLNKKLKNCLEEIKSLRS